MTVIARITHWKLVMQTSTDTIPNVQLTNGVVKIATTMQTPVSI